MRGGIGCGRSKSGLPRSQCPITSPMLLRPNLLRQTHQLCTNLIRIEFHAHTYHACGNIADQWLKVARVVRYYNPASGSCDRVNLCVTCTGFTQIVRNMLNIKISIEFRKRLPRSEAFIEEQFWLRRAPDGTHGSVRQYVHARR